MKKVAFLLLIMAALVSCESKDQKAGSATLSTDDKKAEADPSAVTSIQWIDSTFQDLGKVKEGTVVEVTYRFKNTGDKNLVIENAQPSCGCTVPEKPEQPIAPGGTDVIKAKFDSKGRPGVNNKTITVTANTTPEKQHQLNFKVEVIN
jgi:hypothetical protein